MEMDFVLKFVAKDLTTGVKKANGDLDSLRKAFKAALDSLPGGDNISKEVKAVDAIITKLIAKVDKLQAKGRINLKDVTPKERASVLGGADAAATAINAARPAEVQAAAAKKLTVEEREVAKAEREKKRALDDANASLAQAIFGSENLAKHAITLRYALYDVSSIAGNMSQTFLGFSQAVMTAAMRQESSFSQVQKTLGNIDPSKMNELQDTLVKMSLRMPLKFDDIAKIAMLGSQMNVPAESLAKFTDTIAKFTAVSGMTVEDSAAQLGKLSNILDLAPDASQYQALASAIAFVGNESASTEKEVLRTAGQIAAVGKEAGLTASQIIGLSGAFASLAIRPEEARGVIVQMFNRINEAAASFVPAIGKGSDALALFAQVAGVSQEQFATMWTSKTTDKITEFGRVTSDASTIWQRFLSGLGDTKNAYDVGEVLRKLNLDGTRTSKGITALAKSFNVLSVQMDNAAQQGQLASFLNVAYGAIAEDMASKVTELQNSFEALFASMGQSGPVVEVFGFFVDALKNINAGLREFNKNPIGQGLSAIVIGMTALAGIIASMVSVFALSVAGMLAFRTALVNAASAGGMMSDKVLMLALRLSGMSKEAALAAVAARQVALGMTEAEIASQKAAVGVRIFGISLKSLMLSTVVGAVIVGIGLAIEGIVALTEASGDAADALDVPKKAAAAFKEELQKTRQELLDYFAAINDNRTSSRSLANALYSLGKAAQNGGVAIQSGTQAARDFDAAAQTAVEAATTMYGSNTQELANYLGSFIAFLKSTGIGTAETIANIQKELDSLKLTPVIGGQDFSPVNEGLKKTTDNAGQAKTALEKLDEVLQKVFKGYDVKIGILDSLDALGQSMAENGKTFGYGTKGMRDNLKALEDTISAFKDSSNGDLAVFRGNLLSLRAAMIKAGATGGGALSLINAALAKTGTKGKASAKEIAAIFNAISGSIKKNAQTISDYVSDLNTALSDAFSNRYGTADAMDKITSAFNDMTSAANDAKQAIADAQNEIAGIRADKGILEYQLSVAVRYGDTLRAEAIRSKLAKANADLAAQEQKITDNQKVLNKSLTDGSASAIENKSKLRELVQSGNAYLLTLARSGMSSADLQIEAKKLADSFMLQGKNLGFAEGELKTYLDAFTTDFTTVVNNVPKDISITVDSDPALEAVKKFVTDTNNALSGIDTPSINIVTGNGAGGTSGGGTKPPAKPAPAASVVEKPVIPYGMSSTIENATPTTEALLRYRNAKQAVSTYESGWGFWMTKAGYDADKKVVSDFVKLFGNGYSSGGLVSGSGTATSDSIPARLSSGEYVVQANAVKYYGTDFMNALNNIQVQRQSYSGANSGDTMVYLSPEDRQLLRAAIERPINLYADSKQLASTVSTGNVSLARRGLN
jgi:TP901 family phage tail tape measure protein